MQISKKSFFFLIFSCLLLFSNSIGFDLYLHSNSHYFNKDSINFSYLLINEIILPRYLLLSVIYEFFSKAGLPLGWVALTLTLFPVYYIFCSPYFLNKKQDLIYETFLLTFLIYLIFSYSAINLAIIWFLAFFFSQRKIFLIGGLFHPAAFILYLFVLAIKGRIKNLFFFILIYFVPFLYLMYILTQHNILTSSTSLYIKEIINLDNLTNLLAYIYVAKLNHFVLIAIIFFILINIIKALNKFSLILKFFFFVPYFFAILIVIYMLQKPTFLNYFFLKDNLSIYVTWFKFGPSNLEFDFIDLDCSRYYLYEKKPSQCLQDAEQEFIINN